MSNHNANTLSAPLLVSPPSTEVGGEQGGPLVFCPPLPTHLLSGGAESWGGREGRDVREERK